MTAVHDDPPRPRPVSVAYWLWVLSGVLLVVLGVFALTVPRSGVRAQLASAGLAADRIDSYVQLVLVQGALAVLAGLIIGFLAAGVRRGDRRFRRAEVAVSAVVVVWQLGAFVLGLGGGVLIPIIVITAAVLVWRPGAQAWFSRPAG